jgi:hypothetical protein
LPAGFWLLFFRYCFAKSDMYPQHGGKCSVRYGSKIVALHLKGGAACAL